VTEEKVDLTEREKVYGEFVDNMERTAQIWSGILGVEVKDFHVPLMMLTYKAFRSAQAPRYSDNTDDIEGWRQGLLQVIEKNYGGTIQARDVASYLQQIDAEKMPGDDLTEGEQLATHATVPLTRAHLRLVENEEGEVKYAKVVDNGLNPVTPEGELIDQWSRNRCGTTRNANSFCMLVYGHNGDCDPRG
jgi:hypothetical protein